MHIEYVRANEILNKDLQEGIRDGGHIEEIISSLGAPKDVTPEQYIKSLSVIYNKGTKHIKIPLEEVECLMDNIICTANRWRTLQEEGEEVTVNTVVKSILSTISHFDICIQKFYVESYTPHLETRK